MVDFYGTLTLSSISLEQFHFAVNWFLIHVFLNYDSTNILKFETIRKRLRKGTSLINMEFK